MDEKFVEQYLKDHPEIERQFLEKRRFWVPSMSRTIVNDFCEIISRRFECRLNVIEIEPIFEFVFVDSDAPGNSYTELLEVAQKRREHYRLTDKI